MKAAVHFQFASAPSVWRYYPQALFARRAPLLPDGVTVPRLEAEVASLTVVPSHVARYRAVCGFAADGQLPVTYPHVLAMSMHLALMTHERFIVRLMGLIHIANEIVQFRPLPENGRYRLACHVEGHRDGDRGQEFDIITELHDADGLAWRENCTLLARRAGKSAQATRAARAMLKYDKPGADDTVRIAPFEAGRAAGRRYGRVSGDLNPIHLADAGARAFGFDRAVAHGMWSMARSLAVLDASVWQRPARVDVQFKLPLFLPTRVELHHWCREDRTLFVLKDEAGGRPHLAGSVSPPDPA